MSDTNAIKKYIEAGKAVMGLEFGSTRIKAVLIGENHAPIASGDHEWENRLDNGIWTYTLEDIWTGLQDCYSKMAADVKAKYDVTLTRLRAIGFSAMMHGYLAFDKDGGLLVPFRTWRNSITGEASEALMKLFDYNIPQRWSIAHLYQAILNEEAHVKGSCIPDNPVWLYSLADDRREGHRRRRRLRYVPHQRQDQEL